MSVTRTGRDDMADPQAISLDAATSSDALLLSNLLELYIHDLSEAFPDVELGAEGRFGYPKLPLYWSEPERRFAFLIRCGERVAGFILATRGSPAAEDPDILDVAEFFVLRRHRRSGVGRRAASLLMDPSPRQVDRARLQGQPGRSCVLERRRGGVHERRCDGVRAPWPTSRRLWSESGPFDAWVSC